jgi:hypothetical protein
VTWYVVVRKDNGYPLLVYPDRKTALRISGCGKNETIIPVETPKDHHIRGKQGQVIDQNYQET